MLQDDLFHPGPWGLTAEESLKVSVSYPSVQHFFMDTRGGAYLKGCGTIADKVHRVDTDYPHLLMSFSEFAAYFSIDCSQQSVRECYPLYAKTSILTWWSQQYRRYRMGGLSPYLASFFAECDTTYVPKWATYEHKRWKRGTYREDAMLDNLMLLTPDEGERARNAGRYNVKWGLPLDALPYSGHECKILGPAGLELGSFQEQGGTGVLSWTWPLFKQIPILSWILSRPANELITLYNLRPPKDYEPRELPMELRGYVPYSETIFGVPPFPVSGVS